ncbi:MAG: response regulator [Xenococcaceae cyanobacterium]
MTAAKEGMSHTRTLIKNFTVVQQKKLFDSLKKNKFTGQIIMTNSQDLVWVFYLYLGRFVYATGGVHPMRRWRRNLAANCPQILANFPEIQEELTKISAEECRISWEYQLLSVWLDRGKITRDRADGIIRATIVEVLFDLTQTAEVFCESIEDNLLSTRLSLIDPEQIIGESSKLWIEWQQAKVADRSPNLAPVIRQPDLLKQKTSTQVYQNLSQLLDGEHTLRDLSIRMKRDLVTVTRSLLPYVRLGLVTLNEVDDIPPPVSSLIVKKLSNNIVSNRILVACIDDSPAICQSMEKIVTTAGYQFASEKDGLRAIAMLLSRKPDLIFLDLIMPNTNGYEICAQLRTLSCFRHTPIIILTGNDGIVDRVRAKMVGSTDFITKPVQEHIVLEAINKYIGQKVQ